MVYRRAQVAKQFGSVLWWGLLRTVMRWDGDRDGPLCLIRTVLRWEGDRDGHLCLIRTVLMWEGDRDGPLCLIRTMLRWGRWSWWTHVLGQDNAEVRKVIVVDTCTWSGHCWGEDTCIWSGQCWGEEGDRDGYLIRTVLRWEGDRGGHLYFIRTVLRRERWSCWTPVRDQDSAEMRKWLWCAPDQDSAEERKIVVVDTCTLSGQCWGEGDGGGHLHLIRTVLRWGRWSWWTRGLIINKLCDKFSSIPCTNGCLMQ